MLHCWQTFQDNLTNIILLCSVPSAPPAGLKPIDTTSTTILVHWDEVLPSHKNGIITNYTVSYQATSERIVNAPVNTTIVVAPTMHANLTDLIINMKYNISVLASTIKGRGPSSNGIIVSTNQSGKSVSPFVNPLLKSNLYFSKVIISAHTIPCLVLWAQLFKSRFT